MHDRMKYLAAPLIALGLASQAHALSCAYPNIGERFNALNQAKESYVLVRGQLTPPATLPQPSAVEPAQAIYRFDGVLVGANQDLPVSSQVAVTATCLSAWCGGFPQEPADIITFLGFVEGGYTLEIGPCPGEILAAPTEDDVEVLRKCLRQGGCAVSDIAHFVPEG